MAGQHDWPSPGTQTQRRHREVPIAIVGNAPAGNLYKNDQNGSSWNVAA
jgi:hypothetical protein